MSILMSVAILLNFSDFLMSTELPVESSILENQLPPPESISDIFKSPHVKFSFLYFHDAPG